MNKAAAARLRRDLLAVEHGVPAHEGGHRPVRQLDPGIGAPVHEIVPARGGIVAPGIVGHHRDIGIATDGQRAFAMAQPEQPCRIAREQPGRQGDAEPALAEPLEEERIKYLQARNAGSVLQHDRIRLAVFRPAHVIGRDDGDVAGGQMMPECLDLAARAQRRIDLGLAAEAGHVVLLVEDQVVDAGFDGGVEALHAIARAEIIAAGDGAMDDMAGAAGRGRDLVHLGGRQGFADRRARQAMGAIIGDA